MSYFVVSFRMPDNGTGTIGGARRADVAGFGALVWEGIMGPQQPALLLRRVLNVERAPEVRRERLSSGTYELASVRCRLCHTELGWRYLSAASQARFPPSASLPHRV